MRFLSMVKSDEAIPYGPPPAALSRRWGSTRRKARQRHPVEQGGLGSSEEGAIVSLANGSITALDGPFTEAKELIGGYAMPRSAQAEAIEFARRLLQIHLDYWPGWEGSCEIRRSGRPDVMDEAVRRGLQRSGPGCSDRLS